MSDFLAKAELDVGDAQAVAEEQAMQFVDRLRMRGVESISPCNDVQDAIMDAVQSAVREGRFSLTMLGHMMDGLRIAIIEYLSSESSQGYNIDGISPRASVVLRNISGRPYHFCALAKPVQIPQSGNVIAFSSVTRKPHLSFYNRKFGAIEPKGQAQLGIGKGLSILQKTCKPYHPEFRFRQPRAPIVTDQIREVGGQLTVYVEEDFARVSSLPLAGSLKPSE